MISERWAEIVNSLADRGIPLYRITDPIDDAGLPSWAVFLAIGIIVFALLVFFIFPVAKHTLVVTTTPGAKVIVGYDGERVSKTVQVDPVEFRIPIGSTARVTITKQGCTTENIEIAMLDSYVLRKMLIC